MLLRKMKLGDEIVIGTGIRIKAIDSGRGWIRLGIQADKSIPVEHVEGIVHQLSDYMTQRRAG